MNCYPSNRQRDGTILLTQWEGLYQESVVPIARQAEAIEYALKMTTPPDEQWSALRAIMILLSDVPEEPLLHANDRNKASVTNLLALGYAIRLRECEPRLRRMLKAGDGIVIIRIVGDMEKQDADVQLFGDWEAYMKFLEPLISSGRLEKGPNSTLI